MLLYCGYIKVCQHNKSNRPSIPDTTSVCSTWTGAWTPEFFTKAAALVASMVASPHKWLCIRIIFRHVLHCGVMNERED